MLCAPFFHPDPQVLGDAQAPCHCSICRCNNCTSTKAATHAPTIFDAFWDAALAELDNHDPQVELVPHEISAPFAQCFSLYFSSPDGSRLHAKYLRPARTENPGAAVLMFHGYTGSSGDWHDKLAYVARGQSVAALDCRGQGGKSEDHSSVTGNTHSGHIIRGLADALEGRPHKLYYRQMFQDTALLARVVAGFEEVDPNRLGAMAEVKVEA
jgi:cephalosporin-C deacetylase